jgi:hypothetical protein
LRQKITFKKSPQDQSHGLNAKRINLNSNEMEHDSWGWFKRALRKFWKKIA